MGLPPPLEQFLKKCDFGERWLPLGLESDSALLWNFVSSDYNYGWITHCVGGGGAYLGGGKFKIENIVES